MPVNGTSGPKPPAVPPSTTNTTTSTNNTRGSLDLPDAQSPLLDTADDSTRPSWQPRTGRYRPPDETSGVSLTSDEKLTQAIDQYQSRVVSILGGDALALARNPGLNLNESQTLTSTQRSDLVRATEDLLRDVPIGKLSPAFANDVQSALQEQGITRDVSNTRLGDLGSVGGDLARRWANDMREQSPGAFYALGAGAAAAAGYAAWDKGSAGLRALGIRPEVSSHVFDPRFTVRGGVDFDPHLQHFSGRVEGDYNTPNFHLSAVGDIDTSGRLAAASLGAAYTSGNLAAGIQATERNNKLDSASAMVLYNTPTFALSAGVLYSGETRRTSGGLEAQWRPQPNIDFGLSARHDDRGENYIGIGIRSQW